jgi:uncharacterized protein
MAAATRAERVASLKALARRVSREDGWNRRPPSLAEIIARLRPLEGELRRRGMLRLYVFGSVVRGEQGSGSDVDLMADFDSVRPLSVIRLGSLQRRLEEVLGCRVDLGIRSSLTPEAAAEAAREAIAVFE